MQSVRDRDRSPPFGMWMTSHGQCPRGGGCLGMSKSGCVFQFFGGRMTSRVDHADNVQGGGGASPPPPPPFMKSCIRACLTGLPHTMDTGHINWQNQRHAFETSYILYRDYMPFSKDYSCHISRREIPLLCLVCIPYVGILDHILISILVS